MTTEAKLYSALKYRVDVDRHGTRMYYNSAGQLHREDGPAIVHTDGTAMWYQNGQRHREAGPAVVYADGTRLWYQNGSLHRTDGPAVEWSDGGREWWLNGVRYSEHAYLLCVANHSSSITEP